MLAIPMLLQELFSETSLRIAYRLSDKVAFKLNGTFSKGKDWIADNYTDLNSHCQ